MRNEEVRNEDWTVLAASVALALFGSFAAGGQDPCLAVMRGDKSATQACVDFEIQRLREPRFVGSAVQTLNGLGEAAVPALKAALEDSDAGVRAGAADALGRMGPRLDRSRQKEIALALAKLSSDSESPVRQEAAVALGRIGVDDEAVIQALEIIANDTDSRVRSLAKIALEKMRGAKRP